MMIDIIAWIVSIVLAATTAMQAPPEPVETEIGTAIASVTFTWDDQPTCWEDEVIVVVVHDPYGMSPGEGTLGCVPADDLPTTGFRP